MIVYLRNEWLSCKDEWAFCFYDRTIGRLIFDIKCNNHIGTHRLLSYLSVYILLHPLPTRHIKFIFSFTERHFRTFKYTDMEGRINWRCDRLLVHIILGRMSARCQRALKTKEFSRLPNPRLVAEIEANMKRGQDEVVHNREIGVVHRSADADALAAERGLRIITVRVTPAVRGSDSCHFPDSDSDDEPMAAEVTDSCTCHTVKLCRDASGRGTAFCSCPSPSACLCKHIHGVCCFLSGGNPNFGGLAAHGLCMTDFRQDRDPDDFDSEIDGELRLGPAVLVSGASDDDEPALPSTVGVYDHAALASILQTIDSEFARLVLAPKAEQDALCDEVIHSLRDRQQRRDTRIHAPQRQGRARQSAAARPTSGPQPEATSDAVAHFWAATAIGRPVTTGKAPHRSQIPPGDVLVARLAKSCVVAAAASPLVMATAAAATSTAVTTAARQKTPLLTATASGRTSTTRPTSATAAPVAVAAAGSSWAYAPRPHVVATTTLHAIGANQADSAPALSPPRSRAPVRGPPDSPSTTNSPPKRYRPAAKPTATTACAPHK